MPSKALKNAGSWNGSPWGWPLTVITVPIPGTQSMLNCSPGSSFLWTEKICPMRTTLGISLENAALSMLSSMPRANSLPSSPESISRSIVMATRLAPGSAMTSCAVLALAGR